MGRPADVRFLKSHEWARRDGSEFCVGVSDYAVEQMNHEIVYVELPAKGKQVRKGESFGVIESVKAASDLYAPISGTITDVNTAASDDPAVVASSPYDSGWIVKIQPSDPSEFDALLTGEQYEELIASEGEH